MDQPVTPADRSTPEGTGHARHPAHGQPIARRNGYRRRQAVKYQAVGEHPDRNAQFENLAGLKAEYLAAGLPVLSIDTKKKELLGNFYRDGVIDTQETIRTNDHDFVSQGDGVLIPHGLYDVGATKASCI